MPGIAGILAPAPFPGHERDLHRMLATMRHAEASVSGTRIAAEMGVYAGWVAHAGSFAERQSTCSSEAGAELLFSGECHADGRLFDLYEAQGDRFPALLNGLFSGLLIDRRRSRFLLFNDRFGIERLYVAEDGDTVWFASEAKALLAVLPVTREFDEQGLAQFLTFGSTRQGRTLFRRIRFLPGGSIWCRTRGGALERSRYFVPGDWERLGGLDDRAFEDAFVRTFQRILPRYLSGHRRVGISLTAGLDTRMIMASLSSSTAPAIAYTYGPERGETLDASIAGRVAAACGVPHEVLRISREFLSSFGSYVDRTVAVTDGCAGATGAHELYLSERAGRLAPVRLTGNYGSEVLRGVSDYESIGLQRSIFDPGFLPTLDSAVAEARAQSASTHPVTRAAFEEVPWHLYGTLASARSQLTLRTPYLDNELVQLAYRASPRQRTRPDLAVRLIQTCNPVLAKIATDRGVAALPRTPAYLLRRALREATFRFDYWHKEGMPHALMWTDSFSKAFPRLRVFRPHRFLAYRPWFRRELARHVRDVVRHGAWTRLPFLDAAGALRVVDDHVSGRRNCTAEINALLTLEAVDRVLLRRRDEVAE